MAHSLHKAWPVGYNHMSGQNQISQHNHCNWTQGLAGSRPHKESMVKMLNSTRLRFRFLSQFPVQFLYQMEQMNAIKISWVEKHNKLRLLFVI